MSVAGHSTETGCERRAETGCAMFTCEKRTTLCIERREGTHATSKIETGEHHCLELNVCGAKSALRPNLPGYVNIPRHVMFPAPLPLVGLPAYPQEIAGD